MEAGRRPPLPTVTPWDARTPRIQPDAAPSARRHAAGRRAKRARPAAGSRCAAAAAPSAAADASDAVQLRHAHMGRGSAGAPPAGELRARRGDAALTGGAACVKAAGPRTHRSSMCSVPRAAVSAGSASSAVRGAGPAPAAVLPGSAGDAAPKDGGPGTALPGEGGAASACGGPRTAASRGRGRAAPAQGETGLAPTAGRCRGRGWPAFAVGVSCARRHALA